MIDLAAFDDLLRGMAQLSSRPVAATLRCISRVHNECFRFVDETTGVPLRDVRYRITGPSVIVEGRTERDGFTERVFTGDRIERLTVTRLPDEDDEPDTPPPSVTCP